MARIKILDLPRDLKISQAELKNVLGGIDTVPLPEKRYFLSSTAWGTRIHPPLTMPIPIPTPLKQGFR